MATNSLLIDIATCLWAFSFANITGQKLDADDCIDNGIVVYVVCIYVGFNTATEILIELLKHSKLAYNLGSQRPMPC